MSNSWNINAVWILGNTWYTHSHNHTHTQRTSCGSRSWYKDDPQRVAEQNCKSVLCLKHTHGGTDGQRDPDVGRDMIWVLNVHTSGVSACVLMSVSFSSLLGCNFPSLLPSGEKMVSIATGWMIYFVWVLMDIFWVWCVSEKFNISISIYIIFLLFVCVLSLGRIFI